MPEPDPAKRFWILGTVALVVVLAVSGFVFGVFDSQPAVHVKATCLGFGKSADGTSTVARIVLTPVSADVHYDKLLDSSRQMLNGLPFGSELRSDSQKGVLTWDPYRATTNPFRTIQPALLAVTNEFELPADGRKGRIVVRYLIREPPAPGWLQGMGKTFGVRPGRTYTIRSVECDEEIQCPLVRSNGTLEPARVVPKGNDKRQ